jgi:hypothetical protein
VSLDAHLAVAVGADAVEFALTVENAGDDPVELTFRNGMTADVAVFADTAGGDPDATLGDDAPVWRWSDGRMFTQAIRTETLTPGESLTEELAWSDPPAGTYTAEATLEASEAEIGERAAFDV